jgi:hypothetical protein
MARMHEFQTVNKPMDNARRMAVPSGWIYYRHSDIGIFVPDPTAEHVVAEHVRPTDEALRNEYNRGRESVLKEVIEYLQNSVYSFVTADLIKYFADRTLRKEKS